MIELHEKLIEVIEDINDFYLCDVKEQNGQYYIDLNKRTPAGEDWWVTIWFDGTNEGFVESFKDYYNGFDVDEEVEIWIEGRGKNGVPSSIRVLLNDAEWKEETLEMLLDDLENIIMEIEEE